MTYDVAMKRLFLGCAFVSLLSLPAFTFAQSGELTVQATAALSQTVPLGAQRVPMLTLSLKNDCSAAATVRSLQVKHGGRGDSADLSRVYVFQEGKRISRSTSFSSSTQLANLRFTPVTLAPCGQATLTILADISQDAAFTGEHRLSLERVEAEGATVTIQTSAQSQNVNTAPQNVGGVTAEFLELPRTLRYGANRVVARMRLTADNERDQQVLSLRLTNDGSARGGDLQNIHAETNAGKTLTPVMATLDGDAVTLMFEDPFIIGRNEEHLVIVKADVRASRKRTVRFIVEEEADIVAEPYRAPRN